MKKVFLLLMVAAIMFGCKKSETPNIQTEKVYQDVSFNVNEIDPDADRDGPPEGVPLCGDNDPTYAEITVMYPDGVTTEDFTVQVFRMPDGQLYTQAVRLPIECDGDRSAECCELFTLTKFIMYYDLDPNDEIEPVIVYAAPMAGSTAQEWLDYPERMLDIEFQVCEFTKIGVDVDVLCFEPAEYLSFGFVWFEAHEVVLREFCFFGDICLEEFPWYTGDWAPYTGEFDMPAIFYVTAEKWTPGPTYPTDPNDGSWELYTAIAPNEYSNESYNGIGAPVCLPLADYLEKEDKYRLLVWILQPTYNQVLDWVAWGYIEITDDLAISDLDGNGIIEFVIGDCNEYAEQLGNYPPPAQRDVENIFVPNPMYE